jgi:hypothetical protein
MNKESKDKLNTSFASAANSLTGFFKASILLQEESFKQGQIDAYKEIIEFCLKCGNGDVTNINTHEMILFLKEKIREANNRPSSTTQNAAQTLRFLAASTAQPHQLASHNTNMYSNTGSQYSSENCFPINNRVPAPQQPQQLHQVQQQQVPFPLGLNVQQGFGGMTTSKPPIFTGGSGGFINNNNSNNSHSNQGYSGFTSPDLNMMKNIENKPINTSSLSGGSVGVSERSNMGFQPNLFSSNMSHNIEFGRNQTLRMETSKY